MHSSSLKCNEQIVCLKYSKNIDFLRMLWSDLCVIRMINDDHLIYNTKGKSFKYLVWQINILLAGRQWTVKIVSHWTLQRNLILRRIIKQRKMLDQVWHRDRDPPNYWMSAFVSLPSGLISWDIWYCQPNTSQWSPDISAMAWHHRFGVLWTDKTLTRSVYDRRIER